MASKQKISRLSGPIKNSQSSSKLKLHQLLEKEQQNMVKQSDITFVQQFLKEHDSEGYDIFFG